MFFARSKTAYSLLAEKRHVLCWVLDRGGYHMGPCVSILPFSGEGDLRSPPLVSIRDLRLQEPTPTATKRE